MSFPNLFSPGKIGECNLKNRIIMPLFPTKYATESKVTLKIMEFYREKRHIGSAQYLTVNRGRSESAVLC